MLRGLGSGKRCLRMLCDEGEAAEVVESGGGGAADTQGGGRVINLYNQFQTRHPELESSQFNQLSSGFDQL
jgi:hypothetical protein